MARVTEREYTVLNDRDIAALGFGATPAGVAGYRDLQTAVYSLQPQDTQAAQDAADSASKQAQIAASNAANASSSAQSAQGRADDAYSRANAAYSRADAAYELADEKVAKDAGLPWAAPTGTASRLAFTTYDAPTISDPPTKAEVQALADALQAHSRALKAVVDDLRANHALTG